MITERASIRALVTWALYDWAGSAYSSIILTFIFATYFTQGIAPNSIVGTDYWGKAIAISGLIIAIISPFLGAIADNEGRRKPWIAFFTLCGIISAGLLWFAKPSVDYLNWALVWVIFGAIVHEVGMVFYNSMLGDLVSNKYVGRLSGWGWGAGYAGGMVSLTFALIFISEGQNWFHLDSKMAEQVRICGPLVAVWLAIFSIPFFVMTPDRPSTGIGIQKSMHLGLKMLINTFKNLPRYKQIWRFLIARMIYIDGMNTLFAFGGIYAAGTFGFSTSEVVQFGITMNITAGIGAFILGWVDDLIGPKKVILLSLIAMIILGTGILLIKTVIFFWLIAMGLGLFVGPVQSASRSLLIHITPKEQITEVFGLYALSGRVTAFAGPWLLGTLTLAFDSQRVGMSVVLLFLSVGGLLLIKVKPQKVSAGSINKGCHIFEGRDG